MIRCQLCGREMDVLDEWGRWAGEPAHAVPCVRAAREALEEIAEHGRSQARARAARQLLRRAA